MGLEQKINNKLNEYPLIKKYIKSTYQHIMYAVSPKIKSEGDIKRVSPNDKEHEYFFGYYDKSPWDVSDRYMLCLKANHTRNDVAPKETAKILIIDTKSNHIYEIAETHSWNVQQGCMLQWLGPNYDKKVLFNDYREGNYCSIILTLDINEDKIKIIEERKIDMPVYSVSNDGKFALTLDFSRLHRLRPGYGYSNKQEETYGIKLPDETCIWYIDLINNDIKSLLKYTDFANFEPRKEMKDAEHKVNHIMINPNGNRFMVLHRWFNGQHKYTRLITCNLDGSGMYNLSDDGMVSHCCWKNNDEIFSFLFKKEEGNGYYLLKDKSKQYTHYWKHIDFDGHPSFSPNGKKIVFDRYPNKYRIASVMVADANDINGNSIVEKAKVFSPFKYDNETRCDLHPRWSRNCNKISFDSVFEGKRGLFIVEVKE
ncbi:hypothetical protein [[Eubacterium] hominis]|uniref:hypothetical protein n=1 Tax=[Eubacterium] hominis TaxID=2764325 RepID=UPI003A4D2570